MKCPICGAEMKSATACKGCGSGAENSREKLRVEYKDFKISELLEIRQGYQPAREDVKLPSTGGGAVSSADRRRRSIFFMIVPIIVILAFAAGVIYLLNYLSLW